MLATLATVVGAIVLLYVLVKVHIYLVKSVWQPVWEEERQAENGTGGEQETDAGSGHRGWDEVR